MNTGKKTDSNFVGEFNVSIDGGSSIRLTQVDRHEFSHDWGGYLTASENGTIIFLGYAEALGQLETKTYYYKKDFMRNPYVDWFFEESGKRVNAIDGEITITTNRDYECVGKFKFTDVKNRKIEGTFEINWEK